MSEFTEDEKQKFFNLLENIAQSNAEILFWLEFAYRKEFQHAYKQSFRDIAEQNIFEAIDGSRTIRDIVAVTGHSKKVVETRIGWLYDKGFITKNIKGHYIHSIGRLELAQRLPTTGEGENDGEPSITIRHSDNKI